MAKITLEDYLLNSMVSNTKKELKPLLDNISIYLSRRMQRGEERQEAISLAQRVIVEYGAIYESLKMKLRESDKKTSNTEDSFLRSYVAYAAAEGILQFLGSSNGEALVQSISTFGMPTGFNVRFDVTDSTVLLDVAKSYADYLESTTSLERTKRSIELFFQYVSEYAFQNMASPINSKYFENFKENSVSGNLSGKAFEISGIKRRERIKPTKKEGGANNSDETHRKYLQDVCFQLVKNNEIVGNKEAVVLIDGEVACLMNYDSAEMRNPFAGFKQYILLAGKPGTGKTMLAHYAMTYAQAIAQKNKKQLSMVELYFEDRFQYGPVDNIRTQLKQITEGNQIYIAFIDEIDTKIPARDKLGKKDYKDEVVGEFLRFRGQGGYINKGNYIIIATTNKPEDLDKALLDVFQLVEVEGPLTASEKVQVLYNNLLRGIKRGNVKIKENEWEKIGNYLLKNNLSGRELKNVAEDSESKYRRIAGQTAPLDITASETEKRTEVMFSKNGDVYTTRVEDILKSVDKQVIKRERGSMSYLTQ